MSTNFDLPNILIERPFVRDVVLETGPRAGVSGAGVPGQVGVWATTTRIGGDADLLWDAANGELDVSGPGTSNGTVWGDATAAGGTGVAGTGDASGGTGLYGRGAADGVYGTSSAGTGVQGVTTTGTAVDARPQSSGSIGLHVGALHTGAQPVVVDQQASPTQPAFLGRIDSVDTIALSPTGKGGAYFTAAALATTATDGDVYLPASAGVPTGVPVGHTGTIPLRFDSTNHHAYAYLGGAWVQLDGGTLPSFADAETPGGAVNGSNTAFTLAHAPSPAGSLQLFRNGILQRAGGNDYTLSGTGITYATAPATGDTLICWYRY